MPITCGSCSTSSPRTRDSASPARRIGRHRRSLRALQESGSRVGRMPALQARVLRGDWRILARSLRGVDFIAVLSAQAKGWTTTRFEQRACLHHRLWAPARHEHVLRRMFALGRKDYLLGSHPAFETVPLPVSDGPPAVRRRWRADGCRVSVGLGATDGHEHGAGTGQISAAGAAPEAQQRPVSSNEAMARARCTATPGAETVASSTNEPAQP